MSGIHVLAGLEQKVEVSGKFFTPLGKGTREGGRFDDERIGRFRIIGGRKEVAVIYIHSLMFYEEESCKIRVLSRRQANNHDR